LCRCGERTRPAREGNLRNPAGSGSRQGTFLGARKQDNLRLWGEPMNQQASRVRRSRLFAVLGTLGIAVAIIGFTKTFFLPLFAGTFSAHAVVYLHGAFLFGWVIFFATQSLWVQRRNVRLHRKMGWFGAGLVAGVVMSTLAVATLASRRTAAAGDLDLASRELFVILIEMTVFSALIAAAFAWRRRPDIHKRLMLLALIASLGPAWFRFRHYFPPVENPVFLYSVLLADSLVVIAAVVDVVRERRIHPVYVFAGTGMVLIHLAEVFAFGSSWFGALANLLARPFL